jgi:membrane protein YqaA with SNARE-associated domain
MKAQTTRLYQWALAKAASPRSTLWLGFLFALELFLFVPLDAVLMFFCLQNRQKILLYVLIAAGASVLSATAGYLLGNLLWELVGPLVVPHFLSQALFAKMSAHFALYENWAVFAAALLPLPLKAVSLAAGVFDLSFFPFFACVLVARLLRFSLIGAAMAFYGEPVKQFVDRHFHRIFLVIGAKTAAAFLFFWFLGH